MLAVFLSEHEVMLRSVCLNNMFHGINIIIFKKEETLASIFFSANIVHSMVQLSPWITYIHKTICNLRLIYMWVLEGHGITVNMLKALVHQISLDQFIRKWRSEVNNSNKCLCYRIYKQDFSLESYLLKLPPRLWIPLSRFRCRNNRLPIETGSYENERNLQFCYKCDMQALSDEFHALCICPFYSHVWNKYLKQCNQSKPVSVFRLFALFNDCNDDDLAELAEYIRVLTSSL